MSDDELRAKAEDYAIQIGIGVGDKSLVDAWLAGYAAARPALPMDVKVKEAAERYAKGLEAYRDSEDLRTLLNRRHSDEATLARAYLALAARPAAAEPGKGVGG